MPNEERQKTELGRRQSKGLPVPEREPSVLVHEDVAGLERLGVATRTTQDDSDSSQQLLDREWLDEVVVGPDLEACQSVRDGVAGGQQDDRHVAPGAQAAG